MLTKEIAEEILKYDPESGVFTYNKSTNSRNKKGGIVGSISQGYLTFMYGGKNYPLHRVVFLLEDGEFPKEQVDHINGIRSDNRRINLRKVSNQQNCWNRSTKGVCFNKIVGKYFGYVDHDGKREYLGYSNNPLEMQMKVNERRKTLKKEFFRTSL